MCYGCGKGHIHKDINCHNDIITDFHRTKTKIEGNFQIFVIFIYSLIYSFLYIFRSLGPHLVSLRDWVILCSGLTPSTAQGITCDYRVQTELATCKERALFLVISLKFIIFFMYKHIDSKQSIGNIFLLPVINEETKSWREKWPSEITWENALSPDSLSGAFLWMKTQRSYFSLDNLKISCTMV